MKLDCKEISINDGELGCEVTFSENEDLGSTIENLSFKEIINSIGRYLLLQRTYPEDDFGRDNYYFETHDENLCGELEDFEIVLSRQSFELKFDSEIVEISINPSDKEFADLRHVLPIIIDKRGVLIINE
jgi:hypothetical protein